MPYWVDLSKHKVSLNVWNSPDGKKLILRTLAPDAVIPSTVTEMGFIKVGDRYERQDLKFTLPQLRGHFPQAVSKNFLLEDIFYPSDRTERFQWKRNGNGGQTFGNRQEIRPLTIQIFENDIKPLLRPGYADNLSLYQEKHPEVTHASFIQVAGAGDWQIDQVGSLETCRPAPVDPAWVTRVDDFLSNEAIAFGELDDTEARPRYKDGRTIPAAGDIVYDMRGSFHGSSPIRLEGKVTERGNALRVEVISSSGVVSSYPSGSIEPMSDGWTLKGEEHPAERQARTADTLSNELMNNNDRRAPWQVTRPEFLELATFAKTPAGPQVTFDGQPYYAIANSPKKAAEEVHERLVKEALQGQGSFHPPFEVLLDYPGLVYPLNMRAERNISRLLSQLGIAGKLLDGENAYYKIPNQPYMDLVIERHQYPNGSRLYFTHYFKAQGDSILDAEMVFEVRSNGTLRLAETATQNPTTGGELRGRDVSFANMFSKNLLDQGFGKAQGYWPHEEAVAATDPEKRLKPAMEIVERIAGELGAELTAWESSDSSVAGDWRYATLGVAKIEIRISVSQGGIVQIDGDPFTKDTRALHDNYDAVLTSIASLVPKEATSKVNVSGAQNVDEPEYGSAMAP